MHLLRHTDGDLSAAITTTAGSNPTVTINSVKSYTSLGRRRLSVLGAGSGTAVNTTVTYGVVDDAAAARQFYQGLSSGKPTWLTTFYTNANDYAWTYTGPPAPPPAAIVSSPPAALLSPPTVSATPPPPAIQSTPPSVSSTPPAVASSPPAVASSPPAMASYPPTARCLDVGNDCAKDGDCCSNICEPISSMCM